MTQTYLNKDPLNNIYLIHGLQTYGLDGKDVTFWGAFEEDRLQGILFVNDRFGCLVGDKPVALGHFGKIAHQAGVKGMRGQDVLIQPAIAGLPPRVQVKVERMLFETVRPEHLVSFYDYPVRTADKNDIALLAELYFDSEFYRNCQTQAELAQRIEMRMEQTVTYFLIESKGRAISAARLLPETDQAGMISAAMTLPEFRGRGIYPSVRTACLQHLFQRGKIGVGLVMEDNTRIINVIKKNGGVLSTGWVQVSFKARPPLRRRLSLPRLRRRALKNLRISR
jgi:RimJ/RimL family protein N-acetyltransferase